MFAEKSLRDFLWLTPSIGGMFEFAGGGRFELKNRFAIFAAPPRASQAIFQINQLKHTVEI
ncbi:MAG: hypothetical protein LBE57_03730 [Methanosarcinales archaeon]|nr:hypothetical protein [Methanosarcinales archaeon]